MDPPSPLFTSRSSSIDNISIHLPSMTRLPLSHTAVSDHKLLSPNGRFPSLQLKSFPGPRHLSEGAPRKSELFKANSTKGEELEAGNNAYRSSSAHSPASTSSHGQVSLSESFDINSQHLIHIRHLSHERLFSREILPCFSLIPPPPQGCSYNTEAHLHCPKFPRGHQLNSDFVELYQLEDELGLGGYGFVMTARHRLQRYEVAVKFILKGKVPEYAWMEDELLGRIPAEVVLLNSLNHENIVKFLDLFEDNLYFYLVQELHGTPWQDPPDSSQRIEASTSSASTPALSPSASERSLDPSEPATPPSLPALLGAEVPKPLLKPEYLHPSDPGSSALLNFGRPEFSRRSSYDLFECIEQSEDRRLSEAQARYVFAQVVDVVDYLNSRGVAHRDIKDENLVIDRNLKVKLIDFGSAIAVDSTQPRPYYNQFYGTAAYASSEILLKKRYQAEPAEMWTLGVLLSYLLTGSSPFPSVRDAVDGRVVITKLSGVKFSDDAVDLMRRCLDPDPNTRMTIQQVKAHPWLVSPGQ